MSDHDDVYLLPNDDHPNGSINSPQISPHSKWSQRSLTQGTTLSTNQNKLSSWKNIVKFLDLSCVLFSFTFMNSSLWTFQQLKSWLNLSFPVLQFNCGRDSRSQYFTTSRCRNVFCLSTSFSWAHQQWDCFEGGAHWQKKFFRISSWLGYGYQKTSTDDNKEEVDEYWGGDDVKNSNRY